MVCGNTNFRRGGISLVSRRRACSSPRNLVFARRTPVLSCNRRRPRFETRATLLRGMKQPINRLNQLLEVDRLDQVFNEPGLGAFLKVFVHAEAAEGDRGDRAGLAQLGWDFESAAVGQAKVA